MKVWTLRAIFSAGLAETGAIGGAAIDVCQVLAARAGQAIAYITAGDGRLRWRPRRHPADLHGPWLGESRSVPGGGRSSPASSRTRPGGAPSGHESDQPQRP